MKVHTTSSSSVTHGHGSPVFQFNRMEELLRGRTVRSVTVDDVNAMFVNDPALVRTILVKDSRNYGRGDLFQKGRNFSRTGVLTEDEPAHRHYRRLVNPFLRAAKVEEYAPDMCSIAHNVVASWRAGHALNVQEEMCRIAGDIALGALFPTPSPELSTALSDCLAVLSWETIRRPLYGLPTSQEQRQGSSAKQLAQAREDVRELLASCIDDQLRSVEFTNGYLSALLSDTDERGDRVLTVDQVCDEAVMMLIAGTVTTASVMSWALYLLSEEPVIEEKLIDDMAKAENEYATRGMERSSYTVRFLMEILRLYPPVWISCRKARSDVTLGDNLLPEGTNVVFSSYLLHRNPDRYPDPYRFDPDRWLSGRPGIADDGAYIPFGTGPKGCIGEPFAWQEMEVILRTVTREWRLSTKPGSQVDTAAETTLHPGQLLMLPRPR